MNHGHELIGVFLRVEVNLEVTVGVIPVFRREYKRGAVQFKAAALEFLHIAAGD